MARSLVVFGLFRRLFQLCLCMKIEGLPGKNPETEIGPIAKPDHIQFTSALPKTRSGKIMRRILRKIAENDFGNLGDTSTLADPSVVENLIEHRQNR